MAPNSEAYLVNPSIDEINTTHKFIGLSCAVMYRSFGYKQGPQYVIDSVAVKLTYSDFEEENHLGFITEDGQNYIVGKIGFYELPNDQNLFKSSSSADEESWLPFYWKGVNY